LSGHTAILAQLETGTGETEKSGFGYAATDTIIEGDSSAATRIFDVLTAYTVDGSGAIATKTLTTKNPAGSVYRKIEDTYAVGACCSSGYPKVWDGEDLDQGDVKNAGETAKLSTRFYFDGSTTLGHVAEGKITRKDAYTNGSYVVKGTYTWDDFGNLETF